jgi:hypothetical protein
LGEGKIVRGWGILWEGDIIRTMIGIVDSIILSLETSSLIVGRVLGTFIKEGIFYKSSPSYMNNPWSSINPQAHLDINGPSSGGG